MQTFDKASKTHPAEYLFRFGIPALLIWGGIKLFNGMAPTLIQFFDNFWAIVPTAIITIMLVMYVVSNPGFIWMSYKNLCRKVTGLLVKLDFISYMQTYVEILRTKHANLRKSKQFIVGKKVKLQGKIDALVEGIDLNLRKAKASRDLGDEATAAHLASLASGDKESLTIYTQMLDRLKKQLVFLDKLEENWGRGIEKLDHEIKRMVDQYEIMKEMAKAAGLAEDFANGNTEEARIYKMSVEAFHENLSQKIAAIEEFEKNSKNMMATMDVEKQMEKNQGLDMLDQFEKNGASIFLPESDAEIRGLSNKGEFVYSKPLSASPIGRGKNAGTNEFSNLLK